MTRIDFESPVAFQPMLTGKGGPVAWSVIDDPTAPAGPNVLAQTSTDKTDNRFPLAVFDQPVLKDLDVAVRFKPVAGAVDRAAGIAVRLADRDNYYVVRANALEDNVRLYRVKAGHREQIASWDGEVTDGAWHTLAVEARGEHLSVSWDGAKVIEKTDSIFRQPGRVGLWIKADSISEFDELRLEPRDR